MDPRNGSPYGSLPVPPILPDVVVEAAKNIRANIALRVTSSKNIVGSHPPRPGPITNWSLLMQSGCRRLKQNLVLARDFHAPTSTELDFQVELFPLVLRVARVDSATGSVIRSGEEILLSKLSTPASLLEATCRVLLLAKLMDKARLWYFNEKSPKRKIRLRDEYPLELQRLTQDSVFLLEIQDDDGSWPLSQADDTVISSASDTAARQPTKTKGNGRTSENDAGAVLRKREHRPSSRTSDICSRGNLGEVLAQRGAYDFAIGPVVTLVRRQ
uniref:Uncharacterized protein n=1 Tax=Hyaloperonospora arabidopsidis (strain Emoy2) TaxID=559515 RepID=M4C640_HYAAE